jgi:hypothetical protein
MILMQVSRVETTEIGCNCVKICMLTDLIAYCHFVGIWNVFGSMSSEDFATFIDETNSASVVLQAHFMALEALLKPWLIIEVKTDSVQRGGLTALPSSATLAGSGPSKALMRWPLRILGKQTRHSHTSIVNSNRATVKCAMTHGDLIPTL